MTRFLYKPLGTMTGVVGGFVASAIFKRMWRLMSHQEQAPKATQEGRTWHEVLAVAALRGAVFGIVTAAIDRGGASGSNGLPASGPENESQAPRMPSGQAGDSAADGPSMSPTATPSRWLRVDEATPATLPNTVKGCLGPAAWLHLSRPCSLAW